MRLATILPRASQSSVAVVAAPDDTWIELAAFIARPVAHLEAALPWLTHHARHLEERIAAWRGPRYRESEFTFLPPVPRPAAFRDFDAFEAHAKCSRERLGSALPTAWYEAPSFHFANRLALLGHGEPVWAPAGSRELDFGLALGVIIGRAGSDIPAPHAWEHVAGFTIVNELSARDLERRELPAGFGPVKGKDFATAVGPWMVLRNSVADRIEGEMLSLGMLARINGRMLSRGNTASLHFSVPQLIAHASRDAQLFPGDLLSTGAVGSGSLLEAGASETGSWLAAGDRVELEIERIGKLVTPVVARPDRRTE